MTRATPNIRIAIVCLTAAAAAFPIAIISIAKLLLFLCALLVLSSSWMKGTVKQPPYTGERISALILLTVALFAISTFWSSGDGEETMGAVVKHGKLLLIPVLLSLIRSRREALLALACFIAAQLALLASSWLMYLGLPIPWATSNEAGLSYAVFSSYLDQSIMTAVLAALSWHLRPYLPSRWRTPLALVAAAMALICVFFLFQGRTGYVVAIALVTLAIYWELPPRNRIWIVATPFVIIMLLSMGSGKVLHGLVEIDKGIHSFTRFGEVSAESTSSSTRLKLWHRSLQAMAEHPLLGTGAGSWEQEFDRQEMLHGTTKFVREAGNPHQEYLLWGVELGAIGLLLLLSLFITIGLASRTLEPANRKALLSVSLALALACLFNSVLYDALIGDFFCIALGLLLALGRYSEPPHQAGAFQ